MAKLSQNVVDGRIKSKRIRKILKWDFGNDEGAVLAAEVMEKIMDDVLKDLKAWAKKNIVMKNDLNDLTKEIRTLTAEIRKQKSKLK